MASIWKERVSGSILFVPFIAYAGLVIVQGIASASKSGLPQREALPTKEDTLRELASASKTVLDFKSVARAASGFEAVDPLTISERKNQELVRILSERKEAIENLRLFLRGAKLEDFKGAASAEIREEAKRSGDLTKDREAIEKWFAAPPQSEAPDIQKASLAELLKHLERYRNHLLADRSYAANAELRGRYQVAMAWNRAIETAFGKLLEMPIIPADANPITESRAFEQFTNQFLRIAEGYAEANFLSTESKLLPEQMAVLAKQNSARRDLLNLLQTVPEQLTLDSAPEKLTEANRLYQSLADAASRKAIRRWIGQFCEGFLPMYLALGEKVLLAQEEFPRSAVKVRYRFPDPNDSEKKTTIEIPIADRPVIVADPQGINEFTFLTKPPKPSWECYGIWNTSNSRSYDEKELRPTDESLAAWEYGKARAQITTWNAKAIRELISTTEKREKELNSRPRVGQERAVGITDRIRLLEKTMQQSPELFGEPQAGGMR